MAAVAMTRPRHRARRPVTPERAAARLIALPLGFIAAWCWQVMMADPDVNWAAFGCFMISITVLITMPLSIAVRWLIDRAQRRPRWAARVSRSRTRAATNRQPPRTVRQSTGAAAPTSNTRPEKPNG